MDEDTFWNLIACIDQSARGDDPAAVEPLVEALSGLTEAHICAFQDRLAQCLYDIDGEEWADASGKTDEEFVHARCYAVAMGKDAYEAVFDDPDTMSDTYEEWAELLLFVGQRAWAKVMGEDEETWEHDPPVSYETGSNEANWP